jgi:phosphoribosylamine---glycine ligase
MNVLVIGSGGREHALVWKIQQSPKVKKIYCAPGNAGTSDLAECVDISADDLDGLLKFAQEKKIDLTVVGPEAPLVAGIVDLFEKNGLKIFGPNQAAAQLEASKAFSKEFLHRWNIPTAIYRIFDEADKAIEFLRDASYPIVVKADGLAAGKGVIICKDVKEAREAVDSIMLQKVFGTAGSRVVIEDCLEGPEASILAISDGKNFFVLETAQDHKRIFDDDLGPNTGGMGAYSPAPVVTPEMMNKIITRIIEPTIRGMHKEGHPFKGVLYAGLMLTYQGPQVLEFNVRFGDPETQAVLPRLKSDLVELMLASVEGRLDKMALKWETRPCVCVVMASGGYPGTFATGMPIEGLSKIKEPDTFVFHGSTKLKGKQIVTNGGRVLGVTALGKNMEDAIERVYHAVDQIKFEHAFFRRDIAAKALKSRAGK